MTALLRAALIQQGCTDDRDATLDRTCAMIRRAAADGAHLVVLQELHAGPYFCQVEDPDLFDRAEPIPGPSSRAIADLAGELGVVVVASLFERRAPGLYHNTAVVFEKDGSTAGIYRKMHIPDDPGFYEKFYFTPGDLGFNPVKTSVGTLGVLVCWDQWYPEAARLVALQGADIIFYPTAIGWHPHEKTTHGAAQRDAWRTVQRGHAIANGVYVAAVNRVGHEEPDGAGAVIEFWGTSFLADPQGVILNEASDHQEDILYGAVDLDRIEEIRRSWPFLRDRRIDAYEGITSRFLDEHQDSDTP
jgi:N-carbamoylputrescine amidase